MNHLAHLLLADPTPVSQIGNLAADHIKGSVRSIDDVELARAVRLHRSIDAFTDSHPAVTRSRRRLQAPFRHCSRLIVDVFYDHLLAANWAKFSDQPFDRFIDEVYALLLSHLQSVPGPMKLALPRMIDDDWLRRYRSIEGVERALRYLSTRLRKHVALSEAVLVLEREREGFERDFLEFFPELIEHAAQEKKGLV